MKLLWAIQENAETKNLIRDIETTWVVFCVQKRCLFEFVSMHTVRIISIRVQSTMQQTMLVGGMTYGPGYFQGGGDWR